jgi:hypothetical protein
VDEDDGDGMGMGNGIWKRNGNMNGNGDKNELFRPFFVLLFTMYFSLCYLLNLCVPCKRHGRIRHYRKKYLGEKFNTNLSDCSLIIKDFIAWWGSAPLSSRKHWHISPFTAGVKRGALATLLQFH